jgi:hypothetical protein
LRDDTDNHLEACRQTPFQVVNMVSDPFNGGHNITANGNGFTIDFDPRGVCDVTNCTKIVPIQSRHTVGTAMDGTMRSLTYAEQGWHPENPANAADQDNRTTAAGYGTDRLFGNPLPYYGSDAMGNSPNSGLQGGVPFLPRQSEMADGPSRPASSFPTNAGDPMKNIVTITINFETNFFCAEGENVGEWVGGRVFWTYTQTLANANAGGLGTAMLVSSDRAQPTMNFLDALAQWGQNPYPNGQPNPHPFSLPTPTPPTVGGMPCP